MGNTIPIQKKGVLYSDFRDSMRPLDLVFFSGADFVSRGIKYLEKKDVGEGDFSHVGIIVTSKILNHPKLQDDKYYVWESTMSGKLGCGVCDIDGDTFFGSQLRDLDAVIEAYDYPNGSAIAVGRLLNNPIDKLKGSKLEQFKDRFTQTFAKYNKKQYNANPVDLAGAVCVCIRPGRDISEDLIDGQGWLFCSQLVAEVFKSIGILPPTVDSRDVIPMDFINGLDSDKEFGTIVKEVHYIVSKRHWLDS